MKIEVAKSDLESALSVVSATVASSGSDFSSHYLFRVKDGGVQILTYLHRTFSLVPLKCRHEGDEGSAFTVEAWRLDKMLSGIGNVAITLLVDDKGEVKVQGGRTTIRLRSLDPSKYAYWDNTLASAEATGSIAAGSLLAGLGYSKRFVSPEDTTRPEIAQVEAMGDFVWSSDRRAVSMVKIGGLTETHLRVSGKDLPAVLKFLTITDDLIEVLESDSSVIFRRTDGAHVGAQRPNAQFPSLKVDDVEGKVKFELSSDDLRSAINVLSASSRKDNERTRFTTRKGNIVLSMECEAGGEDEYEITPSSSSGLDEFPAEGFSVDYPHILGFIDHFSLDTLPLEVHRKGKGGYVAFRRGTTEEDGNSYFSVVVWRT